MSDIEERVTQTYPMVPIRDVVVFPHMMVPFVIGRQSSVLALERALEADKKIYLATQIDASLDNPAHTDIYQVGTVAISFKASSFPTVISRFWLKACAEHGRSGWRKRLDFFRQR